YGDGGADETGPDGRPRLLRHKEDFDPAREPFADERDAYAPLVWQCRYSGVEVPDHLWRYVEFGQGVPDSAGLFCPFHSLGEWTKWGSWGSLRHYDDDPAASPKFSALKRWARSLGQSARAPGR